MSTRAEIKDGAQFDVLRRGVVYTEVLGWVDMGHARGSDIMELKSQFIAGELSGKPSYMVMYRQDMHFVKFNSQFGVGKFSRWEIKRGRSTEDINRIMLAMMMNTAARFEGLQSLRAFSGTLIVALVVKTWFLICSDSIELSCQDGTDTALNLSVMMPPFVAGIITVLLVPIKTVVSVRFCSLTRKIRVCVTSRTR